MVPTMNPMNSVGGVTTTPSSYTVSGTEQCRGAQYVSDDLSVDRHGSVGRSRMRERDLMFPLGLLCSFWKGCNCNWLFSFTALPPVEELLLPQGHPFSSSVQLNPQASEDLACSQQVRMGSRTISSPISTLTFM